MTHQKSLPHCNRIAVFTVLFVMAAAAHGAEVYKSNLRPHWFAENKKFWYRNDLAGCAREFVLVDTEKGFRRPAFDHARVAYILSEKTGRTVDANRLPVQSLVFAEDKPSVELHGPDAAWRVNIETYEIVKLDDSEIQREGLPFTRRIRPSSQTGPETSITFVNKMATEILIFWIDSEGERQSYGALDAGQQKLQNTYTGHVWLVTDPNEEILAVFQAVEDGGHAIIDGSEPERRGRGRFRGQRSRPRSSISPDGQWMPFVRDHNLWLRHTETQKERQLSTDGMADNSYHRDTSRARLVEMQYDTPEAPPEQAEVLWSADSRYVIALRTKKVPERLVYLVESSPSDQLQPKLHSYPYLKAGDEIPVGMPHLFRIEDQKEISIDPNLFSNPWSIERIEWAQDSCEFTFLYNQRGHQVMRVIAVDAATGSVRTIVNEECRTFFDYSNKTFREILPDTKELIWMSERSGWNHLYLIDMTTGKVKNPITKGQWVVRGVERVDRDKRQVWFRAAGIIPGQDPYLIHNCRADLDGDNLVILTEGNGTHTLQWSPDQQCYIDSYSRVDLPPVHELRKTEDGSLICPLEQADAGELLAEGRSFPEPFVAKGRDGVTDIYGIIHRPSNFDPNRSYPVIENIYAGPHGAHVPKSFQASSRVSALTDLGFTVVQIDGMGTNWRSKAFHDVCWKNLVDAGFPDRILWMKAAAKKYPYMDLERVGIYGGSAGGQNSLGALLTHGDFYKAAVTDCGCHDNRMDKIWWNEQWMGWPVGPHYEEQSNVTLAKNLTGKLLLIVGEMDRNVDPSSTMQVVNALIKSDKDFDLLIVPGAGHGASSSPYGRRRLQDFFVRHLLGKEPAHAD
ncbi:MAG: prolyl oligopeptidase family serine peptidase [Sedimentisphaerales bacterium]|nr:prolyl oligopeptidase family serine peptidase [Sedimentisphaerales bacterium]